MEASSSNGNGSQPDEVESIHHGLHPVPLSLGDEIDIKSSEEEEEEGYSDYSDTAMDVRRERREKRKMQRDNLEKKSAASKGGVKNKEETLSVEGTDLPADPLEQHPHLVALYQRLNEQVASGNGMCVPY